MFRCSREGLFTHLVVIYSEITLLRIHSDLIICWLNVYVSLLKQDCLVPVCTALGVPQLHSYFHSFPSGLILKAVDPFKAKHSRCKVGCHSRPNPPKAPFSFPVRSMERQASLHRCSLEKMTASLQQGLAPLVWLWGSQPVYSPGAVVAVTPSTTQILLC